MLDVARFSHPRPAIRAFGLGIGPAVLGAFILATLGAVAVHAGEPAEVLAETSQAETSQAEEPAVFPQELPSFKMLDEDQVAVPSSRLNGKVVLLDFWASWCRPCRFTLPELERLHREYGDREDFAVVGLAIDEGRSGGVRARNFAKKAGVTYDIYHDFSSKPAKPQFKIEVVPALFLVDVDGKILRRWDGEPEMWEVEEAVQKALDIESTDEEPESADG